MLTTVQYSALGDLRRFGRMFGALPGQAVDRGTDHGYSAATLQALVDQGYAAWDGTWTRGESLPSVIPVSDLERTVTTCTRCAEPVTQYDPDGGLWVGNRLGGYGCPGGELHAPAAARVELHTRNVRRVYLFCPAGHEVVSAPATSRTGRTLLAGDLSGESCCGYGACDWTGGAS